MKRTSGVGPPTVARIRTGTGQPRIVFFLAALAVMATPGCREAPPSRQVADRFMQLYYASMDVGEAATLCNGAARTRLEAELLALRGVPPDPRSGEPRVTFSITDSRTPTPSDAIYTYRVTAHTSNVGTVVTTLTLSHEGGRWLVTSLHETEGPPSS